MSKKNKTYLIIDDNHNWYTLGEMNEEQLQDEIKEVREGQPFDGKLLIYEVIGTPKIDFAKKPNLKCEEIVARTIDESALNSFVEECYGGGFEFVAIHEANNDSQYEFNATTKVEEYNADIYAKIRKGEYPDQSVHQVFDCLCQDGFIEAGKYIVKVSW